MTEQDLYQQRYLAHQKRKAEVLRGLLLERHSQRAFDDREVDPEALKLVGQAIHTAPSSCDRRGLVFHEVTDRDSKAVLGGLLVGGVGWVHRAPFVTLMWGDPAAYKAPGELAFMPYLDAGAVVGQALLAATAAGLAACYINPSIRPNHRFAFDALFCPLEDSELHGRPVYCGAIALGHPHPETAPEAPRWVAPAEALHTQGLSHPVEKLSGWDDPNLAGVPGSHPPCPGCDPGGRRSYCLALGPGCLNWSEEDRA